MTVAVIRAPGRGEGGEELSGFVRGIVFKPVVVRVRGIKTMSSVGN